MTRYFILPIFFLAAFLLTASASHATADNAVKVSVSDQIDIGTAAQNSQAPVKNMPALPATKPFQPHQKSHGHTPTMDELAHIHHFHKGRVKKIKKHQQKCWLLSKILIILCHIALLVIAYLHAIH